MTTSPAGGWRDRVHDAQHEVHRIALATSEGIRTRWERLRSRVAEDFRWLRTEGRPRLKSWMTTLSADMRLIAGVGPGTENRLSAAWRYLVTVSGIVGALLWRLALSLTNAGAHLFARSVAAVGRWAASRSAGAHSADGRSDTPTAVRVITESGDDVATILGRVDAASASEVELVVPRGVASLRTPAAWLRVAAHVRRRGLSLQVIAARRDVRAYAGQTGFAAARSRRGLRGAPTRTLLHGFGETVWPSALSMIGGLAILVAGLAYLVPTAVIAVSPPTQPLEANLQVRINPLATSIDLASRTLPATTVQRTVRAVVSAPTTGSVRVGDRPAVASLEFRNAGDAPVDLPPGTVVRDPARLGFSITEGVRVEPGASAFVEAIALRPGTVGNVAPGALHFLDDGPAALSVTNATPGHGGADRFAPGVSQADVDRVHRMADDILGRVAARQLGEEYAGGLVLPEGASIAILSQQPFQRLEEPSDVFVTEYLARVSMAVVLPETARAFAERHLTTLVPRGRELVPGAASATFAPESGLEGGKLLAQVSLVGRTAASLDAGTLASAVAGASPMQAKAILRERLQLTSDAEVVQGPGWLPWPWLPRRAARIEVVVVAPRAVPETLAPTAAAP